MSASEFERISEAFDVSKGLTASETSDLLKLVALREAMADREDMRTLPSVEDVAETLRLDVDDVEDLLRQVRTAPRVETPAKKKSLPVWAYAGWIVAALALGATLLPRNSAMSSPSSGIQSPAFPGMSPEPVKSIVLFPIALMPPAGYEVGVSGNGVRLTVAGREDVRVSTQEGVKRRLAECMALLLQRAEKEGVMQGMVPGVDGSAPTHPEIRVWATGPGGANVNFTMNQEMFIGGQSPSAFKWRNLNLENSLESLFGGPNEAVGPSSGMAKYIFPPSGFEVHFMGRRMGGSAPGALAVEPMDEPKVRQRLFDSMRMTLDNDLKPVDGRWRQDAEKEKRLQAPAFSHFSIETLENRLDFEVPTKPGTSRAVQDRILRAKADEAVKMWKRDGKAAP